MGHQSGANSQTYHNSSATGNNTANTTARSSAGSGTTTVPTPRPTVSTNRNVTTTAAAANRNATTTAAQAPTTKRPPGQGEVTEDPKTVDTPWGPSKRDPTTARPQQSTARYWTATTSRPQLNTTQEPKSHKEEHTPGTGWPIPVACVLGVLVLILIVVVCYIVKRRNNKGESSKRKLQMDALCNDNCDIPRPPKAPPRPASTFSHIDIRRPSAEYNYIHPDDIILIGRPRKGNDPLPQTPGEYLDLSEADNYAYLPDCDVADTNPNAGGMDVASTKADSTETENHTYQNNTEAPVDACKGIGKRDGSSIGNTTEQKPSLVRRQNSYEAFPISNSRF